MSKIFRTVSTIMITVGLVFLYIYVKKQGSSSLDILQRPSYYVVQSYWFVFVSGIAVLLFSLAGSFFSWFREFDVKEEILPNAGYASDQEIQVWVGSSGGAEATEVLETVTALHEKQVESLDKTVMIGRDD